MKTHDDVALLLEQWRLVANALMSIGNITQERLLQLHHEVIERTKSMSCSEREMICVMLIVLMQYFEQIRKDASFLEAVQ